MEEEATTKIRTDDKSGKVNKFEGILNKRWTEESRSCLQEEAVFF